jgi:hypothetical protein
MLGGGARMRANYMVFSRTVFLKVWSLHLNEQLFYDRSLCGQVWSLWLTYVACPYLLVSWPQFPSRVFLLVR